MFGRRQGYIADLGTLTWISIFVCSVCLKLSGYYRETIQCRKWKTRGHGGVHGEKDFYSNIGNAYRYRLTRSERAARPGRQKRAVLIARTRASVRTY